MMQEIGHVLISAKLEDFACAADELGWQCRPVPCLEGARAAWVPDEGGEVIWIEPVGAPVPVLRLTGTDILQLEEDLALLAGVVGPADLMDAIAASPDRNDLMANLRLGGLLARGPYDQALGAVLSHALNAGDGEMQAAVSEGLVWTEWGELAEPIWQSLHLSPISREVRERLVSILARLDHLRSNQI
jgi:hypothetical protein